MQYIVRGPDGREYGPVDLPTLKEWIRQGRISHDSKVRNLGNGMLLMASNMPELDGCFGIANPMQAMAHANYPRAAAAQAAAARSEKWDDYKFVLAMSVLGMVMSLAVGWFALAFNIFAMKRAWDAAKEQKEMSGLAFSLALFAMLATIAIPFLVGYWLSNVFSDFLHNSSESTKPQVRGNE